MRKDINFAQEIINHRTTILMIAGIPFAVIIASWLNQYVHVLGNLGYIGSFIAGGLYSYSTTSISAAAVIFVLGKAYHPFVVAAIGAAGALISDYLIFRFIKDGVVGELHLLAKELHIHISKKTVKSNWMKWSIGIIAALIIASPLPDAIAVALLAVANYRARTLAAISYPMNFFGLLTLATAGSL